jgi:hypothetical protein
LSKDQSNIFIRVLLVPLELSFLLNYPAKAFMTWFDGKYFLSFFFYD